MADVTLNVEKREDRGKGACSRIRRSGKIPGILYGDGKDPVALVVEPKAIEAILSSKTGTNTIFDLELTGTKQRRPVMIHDSQRHPVRQDLIHIDFVRINMERKVHVRVHIKLEGVPNGVKNQGGILEFLQRDVGLECLPGDIPNDLPIDVSALNVGQSLRIADLTLDAAKFRVLDEPETVIAVVAIPAAEKEAAPVVAEEAVAAAEPEVIKKGKEKAEGEGDAADKKAVEKKPAEKKPAEKKPS